jgi:hypothetical protein
MSKSRRPAPPKAFDIVSYWDDFKPYRMEFDNDLGWTPMTDIGEPSCQCCGCWNSKWDIGEFKRYEDDDSEETKKEKNKYNNDLINSRWEMSSLEKAHIIPHRLGGPNVPSNFLMLCPHCHYDLDTTIVISSKDEVEKVFRFMASFPRRKYEMQLMIYKEIIDDHSISEKKMNRACYLDMCLEEFDLLFDDYQLEELALFEWEMNKLYGECPKDFRKATKRKFNIVRKIAEILTDNQLQMHLDEDELIDFCIEFNKQKEKSCLG